MHLDGTYAWHFQQVHHDLWDFDCPSPVVLFDRKYGGKLRKGIAEVCKTGWIYILDRTNGQPLIGINETPVEQDYRAITSISQPIPVGDAVMPQCPEPLGSWPTKCIFGAVWDVPTLMMPGGNGGPNWSPMSYDPQTGYFYVTAAIRPASRIGAGSGKNSPPPIGAKYSGTLTAMDSRTNACVAAPRCRIRSGRAAVRCPRRAVFCFTASRTATSRLTMPKPAICCGIGKPVQALMLRQSLMRSAANSTS